MFLPIILYHSQIWAFQSPQNFILAILPIVMAILGLIAGVIKWENNNTGAVFLLIAGIGAIISYLVFSIAYYGNFSILSFLPPLGLTLLGGLIVILGGILILASKSSHEKQLESLSQSEVSELFSCPKCGNKGAIRVLKIERDEILVKQGCPNHGMRSFLLPIELKSSFIPYFQEGIFRCIKCGQKAESFDVKFSGPWALIKNICPTHKNQLPYYKIWRSFYDEIYNENQSSMVMS